MNSVTASANAATTALLDRSGSVASFFERHHAACVLLYLAIVETIVFGPIVAKIGFYLDDWNMVSTLHFAPQPILSKILFYVINDPKIIIRPVEALHFGLLYGIFGMKPLFWHIFNGCLEVFAAWLLYLCANKLTANRLLSFVAAAVFLLYPNHDSTHYWVLASSASLSIAAYLASLWFSMRAAESSRFEFEAAAVSCFAISIFNYECFLPLAVFNGIAAYGLGKSGASSRARFWAFVRAMVPMAFCVAAYCVWSRVIVPMIGTGWIHQVDFSQTNIMFTLERGLAVSVLPELFVFCNKFLMENATYREPQAIPVAVMLIVLTAAMCWGLRSRALSRAQVGKLVLLSLGIVLVSFAIFSLNPEYEPTLYTFVNRINYGASIGASLLLATILCAVCQLLRSRSGVRLATCVSTAGLLLFFVLTNWALAKPWVLSWTMQRHIVSTIKANRSTVLAADVLMLANCPRYIRWAPVFDGVWDFRSMARLTTGNNKFEADVITERLNLNADAIVDTAHAFQCGSYPFKNMVVLDAPHCMLLPVHSATDFIRVVKTNGMDFDLDKTLLTRWEKQRLAAGGRQY